MSSMFSFAIWYTKLSFFSVCLVFGSAITILIHELLSTLNYFSLLFYLLLAHKSADELLLYAAYPFRRCGAIALKGHRGIYRDMALHLAVNGTGRERASGLWALTWCTPLSGVPVNVGGSPLSLVDLCLEALRSDIAFAPAWSNLGFFMEDSRPKLIQLAVPDGRVVTSNEAILESIQCDPLYADAFITLAAAMSTESVTLRDGRRMTRLDLSLEAIRLNPSYGVAYNVVAERIAYGGVVTLLSGVTMTQSELFIKAISMDPEAGFFYLEFAYSLPRSTQVTLTDGRVMTREMLFKESIRLSPDVSSAYYFLGTALRSGKTTQLFNGRSLCAKELFAEAIRCSPASLVFYKRMSTLLAAGERAVLFDGRALTAQQLRALQRHVVESEHK